MHHRLIQYLDRYQFTDHVTVLYVTFYMQVSLGFIGLLPLRLHFWENFASVYKTDDGGRSLFADDSGSSPCPTFRGISLFLQGLHSHVNLITTSSLALLFSACNEFINILTLHCPLQEGIQKCTQRKRRSCLEKGVQCMCNACACMHFFLSL